MTSSADQTSTVVRRRRVAGSRPARGSAVAPRPSRTAATPPRATATRTRDRGERHTPVLALTAAGLALVLLLGVLAYALRPALTDTARAQAVSSARTSLESLLSYSAADFDRHVAEITPRLAPPFREEFRKAATADIKPMAVKNGATVRARVYEAGVMDTAGDGAEGTTVRVMAFVNQATTTEQQPTPAIDQNRVIATMTRVGDRWLISALQAY